MNTLFFELLRLSLGTANNLTRQPSADEWDILYKMSVKQSLVGICFVGVRQYMEVSKLNGKDFVIPAKIYYQWLGTAAHIQEMNELVNQRCVEVEQKLQEDGVKSCVLKGQGIASLYGNLSDLRQPGDIDVWALGDPKSVIAWARKTGTMTYYDYHHADISIFKDAEVELHYRPTLSRNLLRNSRLQRWFNEEGTQHIIFKEELGFSVPDYLFNVVLILNHNFWHLMYEGVGLRQIMDLFFVLRSINDSEHNFKQIKEDAMNLIKKFGLQRFAAASMWIMEEVLGLEKKYLLCKPDITAGRFLLEEIMLSGNFGKYDNRLNKSRYKSRFNLMFSWMKHNLRLMKFYPADVLWTPLGILRISLWRRWNYRKDSILK